MSKAPQIPSIDKTDWLRTVACMSDAAIFCYAREEARSAAAWAKLGNSDAARNLAWSAAAFAREYIRRRDES